MCTFVSFVDSPFFFWRVSCEGGFSPFLILIFALGAKVSKCISESFGRSGYIPCRIGKDGGRLHPKRPFLASTKDQPSEIRAMCDRYPW